MDLFATCLIAAGAPLPTDRTIDGVDLMPYLTGASRANAHPWLAWESHNDKWVRRAYRKGPWKLRYMRSTSPSIDYRRYGLFHLEDDIGETNNLRDARPDKLRELIADLALWERDVGINSVVPVPN